MPDHFAEPDTASDATALDTTALDTVADELYAVPPDEFVGARDAAVAAARERGDRDLAKAIGRLRRPTKAAWLANLLARHRSAQLDGLLSLAGGLADAQRTLDGAALRQLSSKRHQLVAAMAREAGRLAQEAGDPAAESVLRELQGILDAAMARPEIAEQVRSGRLTRTLSYTGFGPEADADAVPAPAPRPAPPEPGAAPGPAAADEGADDGAADRVRLERLRAERDRRAEALAAAEDEEAAARAKQDADEAAREEAATAREDARRRVAELTAELEAAREQERTAATAARDAETAAKASARAVGVAASRTARAQARLEELDAQLNATSRTE
ncbi:hypothetical protein K1T35_26000 [Pseudonocardia sp. DSM 110487]|uniref:hypothetical protein n=1 Tax=Pseudonocardia sp. DSM 110487 TaxID=2865833 RepID=UPI001C6974E7|nr:hypothetical protein [Pseudonocardia sp. DSM 110487]QYN32069.1 hypothetical protein K1T35_26000 [Pseudonocardia sp. DSM 110487]